MIYVQMLSDGQGESSCTPGQQQKIVESTSNTYMTGVRQLQLWIGSISERALFYDERKSQSAPTTPDFFKKIAGTSCTTHQLLWIRLRSRSMRWPLGLRWKTIVVCPVLKLYISRLKYQIVTHRRSIGSYFSAEQNQLPSWPEIYQMIVEYPQRYINPEELPRSQL